MPGIQTAPAEGDLRGLRDLSVRSGFVSVLTQGIVATVQLATTVVLARLLEPSDFGIIGMILAVTAFAEIFRDLGLSNAVVQAKALTHAQHSNLFWVNLCAGLGMTLLVAAAAPLVSWFYGNEALMNLTLLMSATFAISAAGTQHAALMQREMRFTPRLVASVCGAVAMATSSIALAAAGFGYWSLAWGVLAGAATTSALLVALSDFRPSTYDRNVDIRPFLSLGSHVTGFNIVNYFHRNLDNILVGRYSGATALGIYSRAYQLSMLPINLLRAPVMAVAFPGLARLSGRAADFRAYAIQASSLIAFATMPMTGFMVAAAHPIISLFLGEKWSAAAQLFAILAIAGFIGPTAAMRGTIMLAMGRSRAYLAWGVVNAACMAAAFLVGVQWGPLGIVIAYCVVTYTLLLPSLQYAFRGTTITLHEFFQAIHRPAAASVAAGIATAAIGMTLNGRPAAINLTIRLVVFGSVFLASLATMPGGIQELKHKIGLFRSLGRAGDGDLQE